ncbi:diguanylate cyclase/phosphodiesterasewith PAS/PAC sensor [Pseudanabaena sp. lw0831]|uniref:PAS domain S-box protein n=1 Tax=Pseudanabaena sp. lw0831 TaxID=1357935 RepID=UPI001915D2B9|nr:PAS domain S-box protein [Pseudanabaena sp. lw0831]GBO56500.1 diguanylate cyclase/phosphodiesterasewith PAS/PAC sensor [Pseudanabaena sp. lw0831]
MQNILDHIQCGIFVLTVEANTQVADLIENDQEFMLRFAIANLAFVHLVFGERSSDQTVDLVGLQPKECLPLEFAQLLNKHVSQCLQTQQLVEFEETLDLATNRILSISLSLKTDSNDHSQQIVGTCQDVTNRSLSKSQFKDFNQKKFSHLVSEVSDAFVVVDHEGVVRYVNQSAENLFGCKSEEIVGETFGLPVVVGESTDIDILNRRGSTTSAEMRVSETIDEDRRVYVVASLRDISERKRVEESLQLRERAIAASSNGIVITDATQPNNPMIYVNPSFERITGYSAAEVLGRDCRFLQGGDRNQIGLWELRKAIQEKRECHAVLLNYRKDGTPFWNDLYVAPVFNDHGELTNYIGIQTDITDQVKSNQRLLKSEERLRTVLTSIKEGITFSDDSGYFSIFNAGMESLTGYTLAEANASQDFANFLYPDRSEHDKALQRLQQLHETGQAMTVETRLCHRDGTFKDVLVSTRLIAYKGKRMYLSSYYDITERKKVETQLRYQNERERLLNAILLKIQCELNLNQILAITVKEAQELLRIDRVVIYQFQQDWSGTFVVEAVNNPVLSILGKTIDDACFNQDYVQKYQDRAISSINDVELADLSPCHKDLLQCFQVKANIVVAISFGDTLWGLLIAHQCIEPRQWEEFEIDLLKQLANHVAIAIQQVKLFERVQELNKNLERQVADRTQQLEQSLSQLERALLREKELNELKSQFISRASHEFRTPLATIQTASDLLRNYGHKMSDEKKLERIDKIQREVKGMTNLLEEVLIIGKTESGRFDLQPEKINLEDFCLEIIEQTKLIGNGKHQVIFKNINAPAKISIDTKFFRQIISNLLSNAIKYSPNTSEVYFAISLTSDRIPQILLEFKDQGIGIPLIDQEKIFDHFYRAQNVGMIVGTGLGMAIIKNSVDILGGTIQLTSVENKGTTVKVKLPYALTSE